ncbi:MAG: DNA-formamidopyrimidine glycosylase family protein [Actinocatenispora sp.]
MPEGDTVWLHARRLDEALSGRPLTGSDFRLPSLATVDLTGWRVLTTVSRGKHLLTRLAGPGGEHRSLHSHLRMDGSWRTYRAGSPRRTGPAHTIRVVLSTGAASAIGYRLHDVAVVPTDAEDRLVGHLGPDLLGPDWDPDEATRRLAAHPDVPVGHALLDQRNLAGIGNLYRCELAFLRGTSPWTPVGEVADLAGMVGLARRVLYANRHRWEQVTTGSQRPGEQTFVYGRGGKPCRRCGTPVRRLEQSDRPGEERVTYWCPACQPGPAPDRVTTTG